MNQSYLGKTLLITGGSRGLGLALVRSYLSRGARVATFARNPTEAINNLKRDYPDLFRFASIDATNISEVEAFVEQIEGEFGNIYGLVNNAAIGQDHLLAHMDHLLIGHLIEVNVLAPILLTRSIVRRMMLHGSGRIVNITSICATRGFPGLTVYSATKGAIEAFTRSLARELGPRGIIVNALAPGFFSSEMSASLAPSQMQTIRGRTPIGRLIEEEELIPLLDMLLFGPTSFTGQIINADGGYSI